MGTKVSVGHTRMVSMGDEKASVGFGVRGGSYKSVLRCRGAGESTMTYARSLVRAPKA